MFASMFRSVSYTNSRKAKSAFLIPVRRLEGSRTGEKSGDSRKGEGSGNKKKMYMIIRKCGIVIVTSGSV